MIKFLTIDLVVHFHENQIEEYGGASGIRDSALLESAVNQAQSSFGGEYLHKDLFEMSAAYGYHLCKNHPFIDGNKRTALICMLVFLHRNGFKLEVNKKLLYATMIELASGGLSKDDLSNFLRSCAKKI